MKLKNKNFLFYIIFFVLSLIILNKLLLPGYVLTLDMVWPEHFDIYKFFGWRETIWNGQSESSMYDLPFHLFCLFLSYFMPSWVIQKLLLILVLFLSGVGAYKLCPTNNKLGKLYAGIIYMINPFVYLRFLSGQAIGILFGYALLPFTVKYSIDFFQNSNKKNAIKLAIIFTLIPISIGLPYLYVSFVLFSLFLLSYIIRTKQKSSIIKSLSLFIVIFILLNFFWLKTWLKPLLISEEEFGMYKYTEQDVKFFTTRRAIDFNVVFNTAAMYGFWRSEGYFLPKSSLPYWYVFFIFILFLTIHGFLNKKRDKFDIPLIVIAVISLILATGGTHQYFSKIFLFSYNNFPLFIGFREPQKLVAVLVLIYSYYGGIGLTNIIKSNKKPRSGKKIILTLFILFVLSIPFIYTYPMVWNGFNDQLNSKFYPEIYQEVDDYLNKDKSEFNVLYFPWHGYMDYSWSLPQRIATPASEIFQKPVIEGVGPLTHPNHPIYNYITFLLNNQDNITNFAELISLINVKYIIIDKTSLVSKQPYEFLYNQTNLEIVMDSDLVIFKNKNPMAKIYETDNSGVKEWSDLISKKLDLDINPLNYSKKSPIEFIIEDEPSKKYIVFTSTYSEDWYLGSQESTEYNGLTNIFNTTESEKIYWSRFKYYLIDYLISGISFVIIICWCFRENIKSLFNRIFQIINKH